MTKINTTDECGGCPLIDTVDRRGFLRDAAFAFAAIAATGGGAAAMPVHLVAAITAITANAESATYPFPASDGVYIDKKQDVIVARVGTQVYAFELACPHQNTALRWNPGEHRFQCPKHHSQYAADGKFIEGRATRSMDRFGVSKQGNNLVVNLDQVFESDKDASGWKGAVVEA